MYYEYDYENAWDVCLLKTATAMDLNAKERDIVCLPDHVSHNWEICFCNQTCS